MEKVAVSGIQSDERILKNDKSGFGINTKNSVLKNDDGSIETSKSTSNEISPESKNVDEVTNDEHIIDQTQSVDDSRKYNEIHDESKSSGELSHDDDNLFPKHIVICQEGHLMKTFLACHSDSSCSYPGKGETSCKMADANIPMFHCLSSSSFVHYSLVCDFINHCVEGEDENFCYRDNCPLTSFSCPDGPCIPIGNVNDGIAQCLDMADEILPGLVVEIL